MGRFSNETNYGRSRLADADALAYPGPGFPCGPYRPEYGQDHQPQAR